ncbi:acyltransferase family protein [Cellulosimicrobium cellulans]|uniref:acyltransferase family protein n=1 Tax=Cellulosimicrobium cellulans TaxID=1710 RepID=UPI00381BA4CC
MTVEEAAPVTERGARVPEARTGTVTRGALRSERGQRGQRSAPAEAPLPSTYYRSIDGLRGVAVVSVVVYHTGLYESGLFGVDIFMVLSGFLITLTLLRERSRRGRIALGAFYRRRAKRLLVPLLVTLAASAVAVAQLARPQEGEVFARQAFASLLYVANWEQIARGESYWDTMAGVPGVLGHMWSLSLTEQFYLMWPPLLVLVLALLPATRRAPVVVAWVASGLAALMTVAAALQYDGSNADFLYLATYTHGSGLMVGAAAGGVVAALARRRATRTISPAPSWAAGLVSGVLLAALVAISVTTRGYREPWLYEWGGLTAVAVLASLLVISLTREDTWVARVLGISPLVGIGRFSYALYLVHVPLLWVLSRTLPDPQPVMLLLVGLPASIILAAFLHHIVAEPVRLRRWSRTGFAAFTALVLVVIGAVVAVPSLLDRSWAGTGTRVLVLGDSLGHDLAAALVDGAPGEFAVTDGAFDGCGVFAAPVTVDAAGREWRLADGCLPWEPRWREHVQASDPDVVVMTVAWDATVQELDGVRTDACSARYREHYVEQLEKAVTIAGEGDPGRPVLVASSRKYTNPITPEWARCHTEQLRTLAAEHPQVQVLELDAHVCTSTDCLQTTPAGAPMYLDTVHFTPAGRAWLAPWLASQVRATAGDMTT